MFKPIFSLTLFFAATAFVTPSHAAIVDPGFEAQPIGSFQNNTDPDVSGQLNAGWFAIGSGSSVGGPAGGNPGQYADLTVANPDQDPRPLANIFSAPSGGFSSELQQIQFDYSLNGTNAPVFDDNVLTVELFGTNQTAAFNTRIRATDVGAFWTGLIDATFDLTAATTGFVTLTTEAADISGFDYYGIRVLAANFADGGGQPGQEDFRLDNFEIIPIPDVTIPEPASLALTSLGLAMLVSRRRCA